MASVGVQPFLRWAGSKRQLLPVLVDYWRGDHQRYVEPFAGSACLFFRLQPAAGVLGDINHELIATYQIIKRRVGAVIECLAALQKGPDEYLHLRQLDPSSLAPPERAARFIYLNRFCFNGLYRTNRAGCFNVPYGGEKAARMPAHEALVACSRLLSRAELIHGDFAKVLRRVRAGDFVYLDPPFSVAGRRVFREYDASAFSQQDVARLRKWLERLADMNIPFLLSYADCPEAETLGAGFRREVVTVKRSIAGFTGSRGDSLEVLISNRRPVTGRER